MTAVTASRRAAPEGAASSPVPALVPFDIGHKTYDARIDPDTAFWALVRRDCQDNPEVLEPLLAEFQSKSQAFAAEMDALRFHLLPSAVYFNPTARCNLDCGYCYIPSDLRRDGPHMSSGAIQEAMGRLKDYFATTVPEGRKPQIIFHGAEPLLNRDAVFAAIDAFREDFRFGIQTNATLLDDTAIEFLTNRGVGIGLSLDGPEAATADRSRANWGGHGVFDAVVSAIRRLHGYPAFNVICTMTNLNLDRLVPMVEFLHAEEVPACMLNVVRCTLPGARKIRPEDTALARSYLAALDRSYELYQQTGRKLVVANFANILISILAPTARRLMCDISPCGGGRSFFALAPDGELYPCSEFIGLPDFRGGNLFQDPMDKVLDSPAFRKVTERKVEDIEVCAVCPVRHFCGAPCPAEAHEMNGGMRHTGAFCDFYLEQARYAFRLIADRKADAFLWDGWDEGTETTVRLC
ncbi:MAG: peptide-modifying radical SAM enzyme CbpB [Alphaproteobacteria bacterium]